MPISDTLLQNSLLYSDYSYLCTVEQDERFMREALREAQTALAAGEIPIGAVIVSRGRIIGRGHNMTERLHDTTAHAEMVKRGRNHYVRL